VLDRLVEWSNSLLVGWSAGHAKRVTKRSGTIRLQDHPTTKLSDYPTTRLSDYQTISRSRRLIETPHLHLLREARRSAGASVAPAVAYNPATGEFLVALTVNGLVNGVNRSWELVYQRVLTDGTLPGGVEAPVPLPKHGTHNWTDANSLEVVTSDQQPATSEYLLSYASVRDGGGFFSGPYDVRQFKLSSQGSQLTNGLVSDYTPRATDGEYDVSVGISNTILAVWGDLRGDEPHVWGRRYSVGDDLPTPRVTKYYYHGGQRVAMRDGDVVYYLHGDHLGSTSLATYGSGPQMGQPVQDSRVWYYPYGEVRYGGEGSLTDFGFTGQRNVPGINLIHMGARWYDPRLGRWTSADSIVPNSSNPQSLNRFSYVLNNTLRFTDPTGHYIFEETPDDPDVRILTLQGPLVRSAHWWTAPEDAKRIPPPTLLKWGDLDFSSPVVTHYTLYDEIIMPPGADPAVPREEIWRRLGMGLSIAGLEIDLGEMFEIFTSIPLDEDWSALLDLVVTYVSGVASGKCYFLESPHPDLPLMVTLHQDTLFTGGDFVVALTAKGIGIALFGPAGYEAGMVIDFITTSASVYYDYQHTFGGVPQDVSVGVTVEGRPVIIWWPQQNGPF
jgi:RHS repeat-associated protein